MDTIYIDRLILRDFRKEDASDLLAYLYKPRSSCFFSLALADQARRLYAYAEENNLPSRRLCEKLGMKKEGLFKEFISFESDSRGVPVFENTMQCAILRKEWTA